MRCRDLMNESVRTCRLDASAAECARLMREFQIECVPIVDYHGRIIGVLTDRDLALRVVGEERSPDTRISSVMSGEVLTCSPDTTLREIEEQMLGRHQSHVVVVDGDRRPIAMLSLADVAEAEPSERAAELIRSIMSRAGGAALSLSR